MSDISKQRVAVLIPAFNEAQTIADVVQRFREALPGAAVFVYDNNSTDETARSALDAGAILRTERSQGKGSVVRRMFADVEADLYLMADGDGTYDASFAPKILAELVAGPYDVVNAARVTDDRAAYRAGHAMGNKMLTALVRYIFGRATEDMLSGYKAFSRRYVKSFPVQSVGFEIETELVVHALQLRLPISEMEVPYGSRPEGSESKLRTYRDGLRILSLIGYLVKEEKPFAFFGLVAALAFVVSVSLGASIVIEFIETGFVPRLPTAVLSVGLMISALLSLSCGVILDSVAASRREAKKLAYLAIPAPSSAI